VQKHFSICRHKWLAKDSFSAKTKRKFETKQQKKQKAKAKQNKSKTKTKAKQKKTKQSSIRVPAFVARLVQNETFLVISLVLKSKHFCSGKRFVAVVANVALRLNGLHSVGGTGVGVRKKVGHKSVCVLVRSFRRIAWLVEEKTIFHLETKLENKQKKNKRKKKKKKKK
jgi:hypothetical protein